MRVALLVVVVALSGCPSQELEPTVSVVVLPPDPGPAPVLDHWTTTVASDGGTVGTGPVALGRRTRRLSVEQLRASFPATIGDTWRLPVPPLSDGGVARYEDGGEVSVFPLDLIAPVLGEADFLTENRESLDVTPSFLKFMDNAAANVCVRAITQDVVEPRESHRHFLRFRAAPNASEAEKRQALRATLRWVRLTFHAVFVAPNDLAGIADLERVYDDTFAKNPYPTAQEGVAWMAVCVHVITDPAFLLY